VDFLAQVWPDVAEEFTRREIQLDIAHVRTRDFWTQLDAKSVDLVCGSVAAAPGDDPPWPTTMWSSGIARTSPWSPT
jgi:hypothetical protein